MTCTVNSLHEFQSHHKSISERGCISSLLLTYLAMNIHSMHIDLWTGSQTSGQHLAAMWPCTLWSAACSFQYILQVCSSTQPRQFRSYYLYLKLEYTGMSHLGCCCRSVVTRHPPISFPISLTIRFYTSIIVLQGISSSCMSSANIFESIISVFPVCSRS